MSTTVKLPDELMNQLSEFDKHTDEIIGKALTAGAKIAEAQAKKNLSAVIGSGTKLPSRSTGQLKSALGISPVKPNDDGFDIKVGFDDPRRSDYDKLKASRQKSNPERAFVSYSLSRREKKNSSYRSIKNYSYYETANAMIANVLEYGSKRHNQPAKPFMKPAADAAKRAATQEIKRVFDEEANKYLKLKG